MKILTDLSIDQIDSAKVPLLGQAIAKMRKGDINIDPGFDGEYGVVKIFSDQEKVDLKGETSLLPDPKALKTKKKGRPGESLPFFGV